MASLTEGFFQVVNPHQFEDGTRNRTYLTLYDSYFALGPISTREWLPCQLRLYSPDKDLNNQIIHLHGCFALISAPEEDDHCMEIDIHRLILMTNLDPKEGDPLDLRTSLTVYRQVLHQLDGLALSSDIFFSAEISDYV
jgi:hypothetical protein